MKTRFAFAVPLLVLVALVLAANAYYDAPSPTKLAGVINDFSPQSTTPQGPYLVHGPWSLQFQPGGKATFAASLTMVRSDLNIASFGGPDSQAARNFHTHHVQISDGAVSFVNNSITVTGTAFITSSGNEVFPGSTVQIEIVGGTALPHSNIRLSFAGPAATHFTTEPYEGVLILP